MGCGLWMQGSQAHQDLLRASDAGVVAFVCGIVAPFEKCQMQIANKWSCQVLIMKSYIEGACLSSTIHWSRRPGVHGRKPSSPSHSQTCRCLTR